MALRRTVQMTTKSLCLEKDLRPIDKSKLYDAYQKLLINQPAKQLELKLRRWTMAVCLKYRKGIYIHTILDHIFAIIQTHKLDTPQTTKLATQTQHNPPKLHTTESSTQTILLLNAPQVHQSIDIFIDIEGSPENHTIVEAGIIISKNLSIIEAHVFYARPADLSKFRNEQRYCHGMPLSQLPNHSQEHITHNIEQVLQTYPTATIYSNCTSYKTSDIRKLINNSTCANNHELLTLPPWEERTHHSSHQLAANMKFQSVPVNGVSCNFSQMHCIPIQAKSNTPGQRAKMNHRAHCAFYDSFELYMYKITGLRQHPPTPSKDQTILPKGN